jgi:hypothetical protein
MDTLSPSYSDIQSSVEQDEVHPIPIKIPKLQLSDIPIEIMPESMQKFVLDVAKDEKTTLINSAISITSVTGAVIGSKIGIKANGNNSNWIEVANISGLIVGDSGTRKSGALDVSKRLLAHLEKGVTDEIFVLSLVP